MKLVQLREFLGDGKLRFLEDPHGLNFDYRPRWDGNEIALPTVLRLSQGHGEFDYSNLKATARALGLHVRELEGSDTSELRRFCVLLKMGFHLVNWARERGNSPEAWKGTTAMIESVTLLLAFGSREHSGSWNDDERQALDDICPELEDWKKFPELSAIATNILSRIKSQ